MKMTTWRVLRDTKQRGSDINQREVLSHLLVTMSQMKKRTCEMVRAEWCDEVYCDYTPHRSRGDRYLS